MVSPTVILILSTFRTLDLAFVFYTGAFLENYPMVLTQPEPGSFHQREFFQCLSYQDVQRIHHRDPFYRCLFWCCPISTLLAITSLPGSPSKLFGKPSPYCPICLIHLTCHCPTHVPRPAPIMLLSHVGLCWLPDPPRTPNHLEPLLAGPTLPSNLTHCQVVLVMSLLPKMAHRSYKACLPTSSFLSHYSIQTDVLLL